MKTFTVILTTVTFLVFAFIMVVIMQDEPEVIPSDNLTSGISDSSSHRSTDEQSDVGAAIDRHSDINRSDGTRQAGQAPRPVGSSQSFQDRDITDRPGHSSTAGHGDQRPTDIDHQAWQAHGQWDTGMMPDDRQEPKQSFNMTDKQVDEEVRGIRDEQMRILRNILSQ